MKASELRIGNAILCNGEIVPTIGYGVIMDCAQKNKGIKNDYLDSLTFEPITLTEEILLKCGSTKHHDEKTGYDYTHLHISGSSFRDSSHIRFDVNDDGTIVWNGWIWNENQIHFFVPNEVKYLHQLQNLYFALTGKELELKL